MLITRDNIFILTHRQYTNHQWTQRKPHLSLITILFRTKLGYQEKATLDIFLFNQNSVITCKIWEL